MHDHDDASLLADNPSCSASGVVQENDVIKMTCRITYSGNWAPVMRWFKSRHNFTDDDVTVTTNDTTVTSELTVTASAVLHGSQIVSVTYFTQPSSSLQTSATNIPSYTYTWTSPTLDVVLVMPHIMFLIYYYCNFMSLLLVTSGKRNYIFLNSALLYVVGHPSLLCSEPLKI